jgi:simple sugar transport system permease protein
METHKIGSSLRAFIARNHYSVWLFLIIAAMLVLMSVLAGKYIWTGTVIGAMGMQFPEYGVMALGLCLSFISGGIDMSFVAVANLSAIVAVTILNSEAGLANQGQVMVISILAALITGAAAGYLNGRLITGFGIPPILATLAMRQVYEGVAIVLTEGKSQSLKDPLYAAIGHDSVLGIPVPVIVFALCFVLLYFLLTKTVFGENLYMMGSNPKAARYSAMNVNRMTHMTYMLAGLMAAVGGALMISTYNSAKPDYGTSYSMQCILICILAGVSTFGGKGKIGNVVLSIFIVQIISTGVNQFPDLNNNVRSFIWGVLLIFMMIINYIQEFGFGKAGFRRFTARYLKRPSTGRA